MDHLPSPDQRSALLDALSRLIESRGFETFVRAPILEPTSEFFPDVWEPSRRGVRALSLRLLAYAGLGEMDASVELYDGGKRDLVEHHEGTAAWFAGIDGAGVCRFGADKAQLKLGDSIVGTMCHEIAHAFREHHDLVGAYRQIEEEETDITTVYLGFGILTTNNTYRFRKRSKLDAMMPATEWSTSQVGYLSPQSMAFLLAAQAVARALPAREVKRIASLLETNQAEFFRASHRELSKDADALCLALGVPPKEVWPSERELSLQPLPEDARFSPDTKADDEEDADESEDEPQRTPGTPGWNKGSRVYRVYWTKGSRYCTWAALIALLPGSAVVAFAGVSWFVAAAFVLLAGIIGYVLGSRRRIDWCSEPRCEAIIPDGARSCPTCGAAIRGMIYDVNDRLAVDDALSDGRKIEDVANELSNARRKTLRRWLTVLTVVALGVGLWFGGYKIPLPSDVHAVLRNPHSAYAVRLSGTASELHPEHGVLQSRDGTQLTAFSLTDETDTMEVWYDSQSLDRPLAKGDHVRLWGNYVHMDVHDEVGGSRPQTSFVASSFSVDAR